MSAARCAPAYVRAISPYVPGKPIADLAREHGLEEKAILKLASNENPLGMSPKAREAMQKALDGLSVYPDGNGFSLKQALARRLDVGAESLVLGNGSNDLLELAARSFLADDSEAIYAQHAFAVYALAVQGVGAQGVEVPARFFGHDLAAMADAITARTRLIFIANPNNPTGTFLPAAVLENFLKQVPEHVVVVLDEAYNEYLPLALRYDSLAWLRRFPNLIVTRTFSKIYGMAGLRVGYAVGNAELTDLMNRVRQPFNVNSLALVAAEAALADEAFLQRSHEVNLSGMTQVVGGLDALNLQHIPSVGNFVTFRVGDGADVYQRMLRQGVIVRPIASYGMPEWLRVTIGTCSENERFLDALAVALRGANV